MISCDFTFAFIFRKEYFGQIDFWIHLTYGKVFASIYWSS